MSYTTHSEGNGVYSYQDENNIYHCGDCGLSFTIVVDYINHLKWHKQNGCCIPDLVFDRILLDMEPIDYLIQEQKKTTEQWRPDNWCSDRINPYMVYGGETIEQQWEIELQHQAFEEGASAMVLYFHTKISEQIDEDRSVGTDVWNRQR